MSRSQNAKFERDKGQLLLLFLHVKTCYTKENLLAAAPDGFNGPESSVHFFAEDVQW